MEQGWGWPGRGGHACHSSSLPPALGSPPVRGGGEVTVTPKKSPLHYVTRAKSQPRTNLHATGGKQSREMPRSPHPHLVPHPWPSPAPALDSHSRLASPSIAEQTADWSWQGDLGTLRWPYLPLSLVRT